MNSTVDPTPAEIKAACELIQAGWDEATRRKRALWVYESRRVVFEETYLIDDKPTAQISP